MFFRCILICFSLSKLYIFQRNRNRQQELLNIDEIQHLYPQIVDGNIEHAQQNEDENNQENNQLIEPNIEENNQQPESNNEAIVEMINLIGNNELNFYDNPFNHNNPNNHLRKYLKFR